MNFKTTKKEVIQSYPYIICAGFQKLSRTLKGVRPIAYTVSGGTWCNDIYEVTDDIAIVTGFKPFGNIEISDALCQQFNEWAEKFEKESIGEITPETSMEDIYNFKTAKEMFVRKCAKNCVEAYKEKMKKVGIKA